jgi:nitrite reductase/ring-hydroxylating ferredoxin subunit/uncharacterized membrane protein
MGATTPEPPPPRRSGSRLHALLRRVERAGVLDPIAERVTATVSTATRSVDAQPLLTGTWLGHAVHPVLTDFAAGAWMGGSFLDLFGPPHSQAAARRLVGFGLLAAVPTALTGLAECADTGGVERRVGLLHAVSSSTAFGLYAWSYVARRRDRHAAGVTLGVLGGLVAIADGYVGGHLSLGLGVGVSRTAFDELPAEWSPAAPLDSLVEDRPALAVVGTTEIVLVRHGGRVFALVDRCTYRGGRLHLGTVAGDTIVCPRHGCVFRLADGAVTEGPASIPQPSLETQVVGGRVEVRRQNIVRD